MDDQTPCCSAKCHLRKVLTIDKLGFFLYLTFRQEASVIHFFWIAVLVESKGSYTD
jgi:hypothetical protein